MASWFMFCIQRKYLHSIWAEKYFAQEFSFGQSCRSAGYPIFISYYLFSFSSQAIELACLYNRENQPNV